MRGGRARLGRSGGVVALVAVTVFVLLAATRAAWAANCSVSALEPATPRRIPTLKQAQQLAYGKRYADARALYLWLLARQPGDTEAGAGLARVDAWDGCWTLAEKEFRTALGAHPEDSDVRSGLVDLYMWQKRWQDARSLIEAGLALEPGSPTLLLRRARLQHFASDDTAARDTLRELERRAPSDPETQALEDELFLGEAGVAARLDAFPSGYPSIVTLDANLLQRWRKLELELASHLVDWSGGGLRKPLVDGERSIRLGYHPSPGFATSLEVGFGNPGVVLPVGEVAAEVGFPIYGRFAGVLDYDYWAFAGNEAVHILNPTIAYEANDDVELAVQAWLVHVGGGPHALGAWVETWGAHAGWKVMPRLRLLAYYTYGTQLDRDPTFAQLLSLHSHVVTLAADWLITKDYGVRGLAALEVRSQDGAGTIPIASAGASFYVRW